MKRKTEKKQNNNDWRRVNKEWVKVTEANKHIKKVKEVKNV